MRVDSWTREAGSDLSVFVLAGGNDQSVSSLPVFLLQDLLAHRGTCPLRC